MSTLSSVRLLAVAAAAMLACQAQAYTRAAPGASLAAVQPAAGLAVTYVDVNLAGWTAGDDFGGPGNSAVLLNLEPGSLVTGFDYIDLRFSTVAGGDSWLSEFVLSVNNDTGSAWMDWAPSTTDDAGSFGPASGSWGGSTGQPGATYGAGAPFTAVSGVLFVTAYLDYYTPPVGITVDSGTLRVYYDSAAVIPEPATYGLMGLGLLGVLGAARRRRTH